MRRPSLTPQPPAKCSAKKSKGTRSENPHLQNKKGPLSFGKGDQSLSSPKFGGATQSVAGLATLVAITISARLAGPGL